MSKKPVIGVNMNCRNAPEYPGKLTYEVPNLYIEPILAAGGFPLIIPPQEQPEILESYLDEVDAVLFIGGADYSPELYGEEHAPETGRTRMHPMSDPILLRLALERKLPLLGICAGCQLLAIGAGAKLIQHLPNASEHTGGNFHSMELLEDGHLTRILARRPGSSCRVNSFHHQAVNPMSLPASLRVTARAFDGSIEAIERIGDVPVLGVQFHPERMPEAAAFFRFLVEEAGKRMRR